MDGVRNLFRHCPNKFGTPLFNPPLIEVGKSDTARTECETCFAIARMDLGLRFPGSIEIGRPTLVGLIGPKQRGGYRDYGCL